MQVLSSFIENWHPAVQVMTRAVTADPIIRFAALLDVEPPAQGTGDAIPPLWHSFFFTEAIPHAQLGADGHPSAGHFLPPIPDRKRMFAGGRLTQQMPFLIGSSYSRTSVLLKTEEKSGRSGASLFVTIRHEYRDGDTIVASEEEDIVYRRRPIGRAIASLPAAPSAPDQPVQRRVQPRNSRVDEAFLFRFSALTNNAHRIHYDGAYTTTVEGFPGLVVHGPLLGLLALEVPRHEMPPSILDSYSFRLVRPAFIGLDIEASATRNDAVWHLEAGSVGKPSSVTAQAVFREM